MFVSQVWLHLGGSQPRGCVSVFVWVRFCASVCVCVCVCVCVSVCTSLLVSLLSVPFILVCFVLFCSSSRSSFLPRPSSFLPTHVWLSLFFPSSFLCWLAGWLAGWLACLLACLLVSVHCYSLHVCDQSVFDLVHASGGEAFFWTVLLMHVEWSSSFGPFGESKDV